jgi:hypothetical protein
MAVGEAVDAGDTTDRFALLFLRQRARGSTAARTSSGSEVTGRTGSVLST